MNKYISIILLLSLALFSGCTHTMPDGTVRQVTPLEKIGTYLYNPVYGDVVTGHEVKEVINEATGEVLSSESVPVIERVVVRWEPNIMGKLGEGLASMIPIPGAGAIAGGLLGVGAAGMGTQEVLRRRRKKITKSEASDKEKEIATTKAEKDAVTEHFEVSVGAMKNFMKTDEGKAVEEGMKKAFLDKATEFGIARKFKRAVNIVKAVL